jgi:tetratricopeptide (TPR) repeat protein
MEELMKQKHLFAALFIAPALVISCATTSTPIDAFDEAFEYWWRGEEYYSDEDYDQSIANYTEAIRLEPDYVKAYMSRGTAYEEKEDYDRAIADYTQAIRLDPNYAYGYVYWLRGNAYQNKRDYDRAIADYYRALSDCEEAVRINPNDDLSRLTLQLIQASIQTLQAKVSEGH